MPRTADKTNTVAIFTRISPEVAQQLDDYIEERCSSENGLIMSRSEAARILLAQALQRVRAESKKPASRAAR